MFGQKLGYKIYKWRGWRVNLSINMIAFAVAVGIIAGILIDVKRAEGVQDVHFIEVAEAATSTPQEVRIEVVTDWTRERVREQIQIAAAKYGTSFEKMDATVNCESGYRPDIQSHWTLSYGREESWGVAQWHLPSRNRDASGNLITKEMALDPVQALDAMAYHFSIGNARLWTCYRDIYMK